MKIPDQAPAISIPGTPAFANPAAPSPEPQADAFWEKELLLQAERKREDDATDIYETMRKRKEEEIKQWKKMLEDIQKSRKESKAKVRPPQVSLRGMTQRLVAAASAAEVRAVLSEAGQAIANLQMALAGLEGKQRQQVQAMIQSAQKLAGRCGQKIGELDKEDVSRTRQKKAEKGGQRKKAEQIKQELRQQEIKRAHREQSYLLDHFPSLTRQDDWQRSGPVHPSAPLDPATEAKIEAMAQAIAATIGESGVAYMGAEVAVEGGAVSGAESEAAPAPTETASFVQMA